MPSAFENRESSSGRKTVQKTCGVRVHNCTVVQQLQRAAAERKQKRVFTTRYIKICENDLLIGVVRVFIVIDAAVNHGGVVLPLMTKPFSWWSI